MNNVVPLTNGTECALREAKINLLALERAAKDIEDDLAAIRYEVALMQQYHVAIYKHARNAEILMKTYRQLLANSENIDT